MQTGEMEQNDKKATCGTLLWDFLSSTKAKPLTNEADLLELEKGDTHYCYREI